MRVEKGYIKGICMEVNSKKNRKESALRVAFVLNEQEERDDI